MGLNVPDLGALRSMKLELVANRFADLGIRDQMRKIALMKGQNAHIVIGLGQLTFRFLVLHDGHWPPARRMNLRLSRSSLLDRRCLFATGTLSCWPVLGSNAPSKWAFFDSVDTAVKEGELTAGETGSDRSDEL